MREGEREMRRTSEMRERRRPEICHGPVWVVTTDDSCYSTVNRKTGVFTMSVLDHDMI